jgi:hypothetical protein
MSFLHAAYSGGAVLGALGTGVLLWAGLDYRLVYLLLLVLLAALIVAFVAARLPLSAGVYGEAPFEAIAGGRAREGAGTSTGAPPCCWLPRSPSSVSLPRGRLGHWSGIYLRDWLGVGALLGGSGVAAFYGAMALGRLATGWTVGRLGTGISYSERDCWLPSGWHWLWPPPHPRSSSWAS